VLLLSRKGSESTQESLHFACRGGHVEVVKVLLEAGADIEYEEVSASE
jgi:ankyrin repeat protein